MKWIVVWFQDGNQKGCGLCDTRNGGAGKQKRKKNKKECEMLVATAQESDTYETVILDEGSKRLWMATNAGELVVGNSNTPSDALDRSHPAF